MKRAASIITLLLTLAILGGCVERRIIFRTPDDMPPVFIELDGELIGQTPVEVSFHRYGTREFTARADGYQPKEGRVRLAVPWYQYPVVDLITEGLLPVRIRDDHEVLVTLEPIEKRDGDALYLRAGLFRVEAERDLANARQKLAQEPAHEGGGGRPAQAEKRE